LRSCGIQICCFSIIPIIRFVIAPIRTVIGSIGITGTAETILVMEQLTGTQDCKLTVTGKDVEQSEKHLAWNGHGFDVSDDVREAKLGATRS